MNGRHAERLGDVALANAGVAEQQNVFVLFDEAAVGEFEDERSIERVEFPVEGIEGSLVAKAGGFDAPCDKPVAAALQLVVHEQADKIQRPQVFGSSLLRPNAKRRQPFRPSVVAEAIDPVHRWS